MHRIKYLIIVFFCLNVNSKCLGQDSLNPKAKNELNIEIFGSNILYSLNYERLILTKKKLELKFSTGLHFNPLRIESLVIDYRSIGINIEPKIAYKLNRNLLVVGVGYTYTYLFDNLWKEIFGCCADLNLAIPKLQFRRYTKSKSKYWGISFNSIFVLDLNEGGDQWDNNFFIPYGGIQYGWTF